VVSFRRGINESRRQGVKESRSQGACPANRVSRVHSFEPRTTDAASVSTHNTLLSKLCPFFAILVSTACHNVFGLLCTSGVRDTAYPHATLPAIATLLASPLLVQRVVRRPATSCMVEHLPVVSHIEHVDRPQPRPVDYRERVFACGVQVGFWRKGSCTDRCAMRRAGPLHNVVYGNVPPVIVVPPTEPVAAPLMVTLTMLVLATRERAAMPVYLQGDAQNNLTIAVNDVLLQGLHVAMSAGASGARFTSGH
jgi:hypothetical protein